MLEGFSRAPAAINGLAFMALAVLPFLALSLYAVRWQRAYRFHKFMQSLLGVLLLLALLAFEWQVRGEGWRLYAQDSAHAYTWVMPALVLHLLWAVPTFCVWSLTLVGAWKKFPVPTSPGKYSMIHKRLGRIAAGLMLGTASSGWLFYWLAFMS